jgi:hypothetical protein
MSKGFFKRQLVHKRVGLAQEIVHSAMEIVHQVLIPLKPIFTSGHREGGPHLLSFLHCQPIDIK